MPHTPSNCSSWSCFQLWTSFLFPSVDAFEFVVPLPNYILKHFVDFYPISISFSCVYKMWGVSFSLFISTNEKMWLYSAALASHGGQKNFAKSLWTVGLQSDLLLSFYNVLEDLFLNRRYRNILESWSWSFHVLVLCIFNYSRQGIPNLLLGRS
jgi:hypothetical protein